MNDDFENRILRQPLRQIPHTWRNEVLGAAQTAMAAKEAGSAIETPLDQRGWSMLAGLKLWRELIWPKPQAWAGVAALWVLIFVLKLSTHDASHTVARKSSESPEVIAEVRQQKLFFAELVGVAELRAAAPAKPVLPRPRSERRHKILTG